ncbi:glucose/arabinose dehydrogenase [Herbihabitans rhizosphaerae]|uniref:Glucose/arabinose dehydrogenase n=2 Tax=Herbihabitans rhizosphaerae TaxID=1872711 RepID=A0A4Q7KYN5_9PSEU|nr:glucose/arabinose dehydrogenase [Herbihabitans rhizosphaerae]
MLVIAVVATAATACTSSDNVGQVPAGPNQPAATPPSSAPAPGGLRVEEVTGGLDHGWDMGFLPDGTVLVSQRGGKLALVSGGRAGASVTEVAADLSDVHARGEGGLMGLAPHPDFATSRRFVTCQAHAEGGRAVDVRLVNWRLSEDGRSATRVGELLTGLPVNPSGRHSGCRPTAGPDGALLVGTGDTARGNLSQDRGNLGGKVLRLDWNTGNPLPGNPFLNAANPRERLVYTFGHRNVQGVAVRPGGQQVFVAEHGPTENDEMNLLRAGGNYGWDPSRGGTVGGYDEDVPMTDLQRFPNAVPAVWESGKTTEAICAVTFLSGPQWTDMDGAMVVTALKGAKLMIFQLDQAGAVRSVTIPPEFTDRFGRLRAARTAPDGALYVTTSNGDNDKLLRITRG